MGVCDLKFKGEGGAQKGDLAVPDGVNQGTYP